MFYSQVVFRLNILPVLLSLTLGRSYGAYNLPVLLTLGFLFTSAFMASWPQMTPLSMQGQSGSVCHILHDVLSMKGLTYTCIYICPDFSVEKAELPQVGVMCRVQRQKGIVLTFP
jgi:hypothetical protein